jgi:anti-sigma factor RsiW
MTPQSPPLAPASVAAPAALIAGGHLTAEQLDQLLSNSAAGSAAEAHLLLCEPCAAELANLRDSISLFRQASSAHASRELSNLAPLSLPTRSLLFPALQPTHWFAIAATLLVALLPLQTFRNRPLQTAPASVATMADATQQSDAALLDDVDREASASVPAPMQALADPSGDSASVTLQTTNQTPDQRKD